MTDTSVSPEDTICDIARHHPILFAARQTGLYRSIDNGASWEHAYQTWRPDDTELPTPAVVLSPHFEHDQLVVAGVAGGLMLSTDGGVTWIAHQFRDPLPVVTCVAISPQFASDQFIIAGTFEDGVFRSTDGGANWQAFNFGLFDRNIFALVISPDFANDQTVFVGTSTGIYRSANGGRLWHDMILPIGYDAVLSLALSPDLASDKTMFAGTETYGLLQSQDGGATWTHIYETDAAVNTLLLPSDYPTSQKMIAQFDDSLLTSEDAGVTWQVIVKTDVTAVSFSHDQQSIIVGLADMSIQTIDL